MVVVKVLYFAGLREALGTIGETVPLADGISTVADLRAHLALRDAKHAVLATTKNLRTALNHHVVDPGQRIADGDEIAFFPPVTGG